MKYVLVTLLVLSCSFSGNAQKAKDNLKFNAGAELILPVSSGYKTSFGVSGQVLYYLGDNVAATFHAGYVSLPGKTQTSDIFTVSAESLTVVPVLAGVKYSISTRAYGHGQLGVSMVNKGVGTKFTYSANIGWYATEHIDISAGLTRFQVASGLGIDWIGLRASFTL